MAFHAEVGLGHFHQMAWLNSNSKTIFMNGGFPTDNEYVLRRLKVDNTRAEQWLFGAHRTDIGWLQRLNLKKEYKGAA